MIRFRSEFLARFPSKQRTDLKKFTSFGSAVEEALRKAPELQWPPPSETKAMFDYYVELIWQADFVRCANLCRGIVENLNELNFLCFAVLFRAFFENVLLARQYFNTRLRPIVDACAKEGQVRFDELKSLIMELDTSVRRSKVDWDKLLAGSFDHIADQNVAVSDTVGLKKAAKDWDQTGARLGALTPTDLYGVLCDLAHPNLGSALVCMRQVGFGFATPDQDICLSVPKPRGGRHGVPEHSRKTPFVKVQARLNRSSELISTTMKLERLSRLRRQSPQCLCVPKRIPVD